MKQLFPVVLLLFTSVLFAQEHTLTINVRGASSDEGKLLYSIFSNEDGFPKDVEKAIDKGFISLVKGEALLSLELPSGTYAIMVFHDEDDNNEMKTNWLGMPKEGVGNSNNHKGFPSYKKSVFKLSEDKTVIINLLYM